MVVFLMSSSDYLRYSGLALELCICLLLPTYVGYLLDERFSSFAPLFVIMGAVFALCLLAGLLYLRLFRTPRTHDQDVEHPHNKASNRHK